METRVAVMSIIVENTASIEALNNTLHEYRQHIIGRMGLPNHQKNINLISKALDAPQDEKSALSGRIGNLDGVSVTIAFSK